MSPSEHDSPTMSLSDSLNLLYLLATAYATCLTVFLRASFGAEALGFPGLAAFLFLCGTVGVTGDPDLLVYALLWFVALLVQRSQTLRQQWKGVRLHSHYSGFPAAAQAFLPGVTDEQTLQRWEPLIAAGIGLWLWMFSPAIGQFVLWGAGALALRTGLDQFAHHRRLQQLHDAEIEQEVLHADWERQRRASQGPDQ